VEDGVHVIELLQEINDVEVQVFIRLSDLQERMGTRSVLPFS
jgi:hypothetical protein